MKIFIDASAFIAYFIKQEFYHKEVLKKYNSYRKQKAHFVTSNYILDELFTRLSTSENKTVLERVIYAVKKLEELGELKVMYIDRVICRKAEEIILKFAEHKLSFTDATTYVLYKDFDLDEVFTLDEDFKKIRVKTSF